ncbi:MAG: preprotein translocase subunit SecG [Rudaea sp.]
MVLTLFNVVYVLVAIAMIALILLQRGAGAQAGSGFGGGASATVFGARGAANFLSRSTGILAGVFFLLSLLMGIYLHPVATKSDNDLGVMSGYQTPETPKAPATTPPAGSDVPAAPIVVPATPAPADSGDKPAPTAAPATTSSSKPAVPAKKSTDKKSNGGKSEPEKN